jgi:hypothetical protein
MSNYKSVTEEEEESLSNAASEFRHDTLTDRECGLIHFQTPFLQLGRKD